MISRKAITDAFEIILADKKLKKVTVFCNRHRESVRIHRHQGGGSIHKGTFLVTMGSLLPEDKAFLTRNIQKYGCSAATPKIWFR